MEPWPGEKKFIEIFSQVKTVNGGTLSGSKIQEIALAAFTDLKFYKYVVVVVEKYIQKLDQPGQVLSCLFAVDAIIKHSFSLYGSNKDRYAMRFEVNLPIWLQKAVDVCNNTEHKDPLINLLIAWCTKFYFSGSSVKPFITKLGPSAKQKKQLAQLPNTALAPLKRKAPPEKPKPRKEYKPISPPPTSPQDQEMNEKPSTPTKNIPFSYLATPPSLTLTPKNPLSSSQTKQTNVNATSIPPEQSIFDTLPADVLKCVFAYLTPITNLVNLSLVCKIIRDVVSYKLLWRRVAFTDFWRLPSPALGKIVVSSLITSSFNIHYLDFSYCKALTEAMLKIAAQNCPELVKLNLTSCDGVTSEAIKAFARNCPNIQKVSLFALNSPSARIAAVRGIDHILSNCTSLRSLDIRCCHDAYDHLPNITGSPTTLQKLDISCYCMRGSISMEKVNQILLNIPSLTQLRASGVIRGITGDGVALDNKGELQGLDLSRPNVSVRTMDMWLASAIGNTITVQKFLAGPSPKLEKKCIRGTTPLMVAAEEGHIIIVEMLLAAGARVQHRDVEGNSAIGVAQSLGIVKTLFWHGAKAETKQERDLRNILTVVEKYPAFPDWKPAVRARKRPLENFPPHSDTEKVLEFVKDKRTNAIDCAEDVLHLLAWFLSNKEYLNSFINRDMPSYRKELALATIGRDEFFTVLMRYLTMEEQKMILMHIGSIL